MVDSNTNNDKRINKSGAFFTVLALVYLILNLVFSLIMVSVGKTIPEIDVEDTDWYKFIAYSVGSIAIIIAMCINEKFNFKTVIDKCSLTVPNKEYWLYVPLCLFAMFFGLSGLNTYFTDFLSNVFGYTYVENTLPTLSFLNLLLSVLCICILPAVFEELAFRGMLVYGIKNGSVLIVSIISGLCFSLFHMNPAQTPYQFAVGFMFCLLALNSGSVLPGIVVHFLNNLIIVIFTYFCPTALYFEGALNVVLTVLGILAFALFIYLTLKNNRTKEKISYIDFVLGAFAGFAVCIFVWILGLVV